VPSTPCPTTPFAAQGVPPYRFINEHTGLPARVTAEPLLAVAKGLLICMEHFGQWRRWLQSSEEDV
jgi:hypothetical protein